MPRCDLPEGAWLAPGFIDVQVNGGGDVLFNDTRPQGDRRIVAAHRRFGTTGLLPTLISDSAATMHEASAPSPKLPPSARRSRHPFRGPFLAPERAGVHDKAMFRPPTPEDLDLLCAQRGGANAGDAGDAGAECVPPGFIASLAHAGFVSRSAIRWRAMRRPAPRLTRG